jgi:hypothetical protein
MAATLRIPVIFSIVIYLAAFAPSGKNVHNCNCRQHSSDCPCCLASVGVRRSAPQPPLQSHCLAGKLQSGPTQHSPPASCETREHHLKDGKSNEPERRHCVLPGGEEGYADDKKKKLRLSGFCKCKEKKDHYKNSTIAVLNMLETMGRPGGHHKLFCLQEVSPLPGYCQPPMKPPPA